MVSKASDDLPEPLGPVTTVNFPSGRSTSIPLRLFWRAPRISMQVAAATAVRHFFSATFEPTGDYPRCARKSQISLRRDDRILFGETRGDFFALLHQLVLRNAAERIEKLFVLGEFFFPVFVLDLEKVIDGFVVEIELGQIEIVQPWQPADG